MTTPDDDELKLDPILRIQQVAKLAGWSVSRMRRFLIAKNVELGGQLLVNVGRGSSRPRWTVTLRALRALAPQWFVDPESTQRQIDWLAEQSDDVRENLDALSRRVTAQHERMLFFAHAIAPSPRRSA